MDDNRSTKKVTRGGGMPNSPAPSKVFNKYGGRGELVHEDVNTAIVSLLQNDAGIIIETVIEAVVLGIANNDYVSDYMI